MLMPLIIMSVHYPDPASSNEVVTMDSMKFLALLPSREQELCLRMWFGFHSHHLCCHLICFQRRYMEALGGWRDAKLGKPHISFKGPFYFSFQSRNQLKRSGGPNCHCWMLPSFCSTYWGWEDGLPGACLAGLNPKPIEVITCPAVRAAQLLRFPFLPSSSLHLLFSQSLVSCTLLPLLPSLLFLPLEW